MSGHKTLEEAILQAACKGAADRRVLSLALVSQHDYDDMVKGLRDRIMFQTGSVPPQLSNELSEHVTMHNPMGPCAVYPSNKVRRGEMELYFDREVVVWERRCHACDRPL